MGDKGFKHRSLFDFFVARVQRYLHVALCMDPANEGFLLRCESNPALYMRCSMLWMGSWDVASMERLPLQVRVRVRVRVRIRVRVRGIWLQGLL